MRAQFVLMFSSFTSHAYLTDERAIRDILRQGANSKWLLARDANLVTEVNGGA